MIDKSYIKHRNLLATIHSHGCSWQEDGMALDSSSHSPGASPILPRHVNVARLIVWAFRSFTFIRTALFSLREVLWACAVVACLYIHPFIHSIHSSTHPFIRLLSLIPVSTCLVRFGGGGAATCRM